MARIVGHYVDSDVFGGCEQVVLTLLGHHTRPDWRPVLLHHDEPGLSRLIQGAREVGVECRSLPRISKPNMIGSLWRFAQVLKAERLSIFHAHLSWPLGCRHGILAAKLARVPSVVATSHCYSPLHSPLHGVRLSWIKQYLQAAAIDRYIAVSNDVGKRLLVGLGVHSAKIKVVRNGIALDPFERPAEPAFRAELGGSSDRLLVLTPARLHGDKGHDYLLEAASQVPSAIFLLAGDGPERQRLERKATDLGVRDRVRFLGHRGDIARLLANSDLFVLPSLYEGLPLSVLEAMAAGKPVVATAVGGTDEIIVDGVSGKLVPPRNAQSLAIAINMLLSDLESARRIALAGQARAKEMFSANTMVHHVEDLYSELLPCI